MLIIYAVSITIVLLAVCEWKGKPVPKHKPIGQPDAQIAFANHKKDEMFDPFRWVSGIYFEIKINRHHDNFNSLPKYECGETIVPPRQGPRLEGPRSRTRETVRVRAATGNLGETHAGEPVLSDLDQVRFALRQL